MKIWHHFLAFSVSIVLGFIIFFPLATLVTPAEPRLPSENYETLEEEYIEAIEHFNNTGEIVIPDEARFSCDDEKITIKDIASGACVTCTFALNGKVPIYRYSYHPSTVPMFLVTIFSCLMALCCQYYILSFFSKKKYRVLNRIKKNATYGDDRKISSNCLTCYKKEHCKCIKCPYAVHCGRCPSIDCEDIIEDMLQEHVKSEKNCK